MSKEISWEIRERAEELYVYDGYTFELVAETTGVSISQLKRWSAAGGWRDRKKEHRQILTELKQKKMLLRQRLINSALTSDSPDPQAVYAFARMEELSIRDTQKETAPEPVTAEPVKCNTPAEAVKALQTVVERKLGKMLVSPENLTLKKIRDFKQVLELIEKMAAEHQVNEDKTPATEADRERLINEVDKILGVK